MIIEILWVVVMLLWFLSSVPVPAVQAYPWASGWLGDIFIFAWIAGLMAKGK